MRSKGETMSDRIEPLIDSPVRPWWLCPNGECQHGAILHDVYDLEDTRPTCCAEGCTCGRD